MVLSFIKLTKDEATHGLHQGMEDNGVSMGLPARSPLDSFVVAALGDEADDVYFVKLEPRRREARENTAVDGDMELARTMPSFSSSSWCNGG